MLNQELGALSAVLKVAMCNSVRRPSKGPDVSQAYIPGIWRDLLFRAWK